MVYRHLPEGGAGGLLTDQNVSLAGSSDSYSRQRQELSGQVSTLREKNRSLTDQNAVLTLKNADLTRENRRLQEQADQAQAALKVKGRELDEAKQSLDASRPTAPITSEVVLLSVVVGLQPV